MTWDEALHPRDDKGRFISRNSAASWAESKLAGKGFTPTVPKVRLTTGTRVKRAIHPEMRKHVQEAVSRAGYDKLFERHPIEFHESDPKSGTARGSYSTGSSVINIRSSTFDKTPKPGDVKLVREDVIVKGGPKNHVVEDPLDAVASIQRTITHESSHHMHWAIWRRAGAGQKAWYGKSKFALDAKAPVRGIEKQYEGNEAAQIAFEIERMYRKAKRTKNAVSRYALTNSREWFAETATAYVMRGDEFKRSRPKEYALVKRARVLFGITT